jgi:hypothetical protein
MRRTAIFSIILGMALSVLFWLSLGASDEIFQTRLLPWIPSLIYVQEPGIRVMSRFFPCQKEGFDTGCEEYKTIPTLLASDAIAYAIVLLPVMHLWRTRRSRKRPKGQ